MANVRLSKGHVSVWMGFAGTKKCTKDRLVDIFFYIFLVCLLGEDEKDVPGKKKHFSMHEHSLSFTLHPVRDPTTNILRGYFMIWDFGNFDKIVWVVVSFFFFTPIPGEMIQFDEYFSNGLKPPPSCQF